MPDDQIGLRVRLSLKGRPIRSYSFQQDVVTIGRDPDADISLDNPGVSRYHARIERLPNGHFSLKDLGSANGTFLNDTAVHSATIYSSDLIRISKFALWVEIEQERRLADQPIEVRRAYSEVAAETMMLSSEELERVMKASRDSNVSAPAPRAAPPERRPQPEEAWAGPAPPSTMPGAPTAATGVRRARALGLMGIGLVVILATSVGAGFAWLFLR